VAEWLTHLPTTLEVTSSRTSFGDISEINSLIETVTSTEVLEMVCVAWPVIVISVDRISGFHLKVPFRIAIEMQ